MCQARILDLKRKFLESAQKYLELSFCMQLDLSERNQCFISSVVCAILSPVGAPRSRVVSSLFRDTRVQKDGAMEAHLGVLEMLKRICSGRLVTALVARNFYSVLKPHQRLLLSDGESAWI